jgi:hypothetical protein
MSRLLTPVRAIRRFCVETCMGGCRKWVRECHDEKCVLWPYRLGTNPARAGTARNQPREITGRLTGPVFLPAPASSAAKLWRDVDTAHRRSGLAGTTPSIIGDET